MITLIAIMDIEADITHIAITEEGLAITTVTDDRLVRSQYALLY